MFCWWFAFEERQKVFHYYCILRSKLCATLIWGMESNTGNGKRIFNKWYQETNSGGFDETDFEWVMKNIFVFFLFMINFTFLFSLFTELISQYL
jgi:hypothetical protein